MANILKPREAQAPIIDLITSHPRCNVFASPGVGKTSSTLLSLLILTALEGDSSAFPVLVVAPLRVASVVWDAEVEKWLQFQGWRCSKILGTPAQRERALKTPAELYVINYENLQWLHETVGSNWPFKTVVADESTKLKSHRCHVKTSVRGKRFIGVAGAVNARSLCRNAPRTDRWINLTGTPTPNGVQDLWGQHWPIDFGKALQRTYGQFEHAFMQAIPMGESGRVKMIPRPGAAEEIAELISPVSAVVDAYDYFDIEKPIEIDHYVHLSGRPAKLYKEMHDTSIVELTSSLEVEAVSSGVALLKCRQIASGGILDEDGGMHFIHDEKIRAVKEILDEIGHAPLIVAYHFKHDLNLLKKAFPEAVVLPSNVSKLKAVEAKWNAGEIPILLLHPQSAGHGLNLQYGGHHMVIFTPDWNAEYYEQVIERIGPTRQFQAGFKRAVFIYRLAAKSTWDELVLKSLRSKMDVSELVKEAIQIQGAL